MGPPTIPRNHDITPDGSRFIGRMTAESDQGGVAAAPRIHVVLNWHEELKRLVPTR